MAHRRCAWLKRVGPQLASFVAGSQIWNNIVAVVLPCLCRKNNARRMEKKLRRAKLDLDDPQGRALLRQVCGWHAFSLVVWGTALNQPRVRA